MSHSPIASLLISDFLFSCAAAHNILTDTATSGPCAITKSIVSASLSINIASVSAHLLTCHLDHLSVCVSVYWSVCRSVRGVICGKTAEWIRMPFGMVSGSVEGSVY